MNQGPWEAPKVAPQRTAPKRRRWLIIGGVVVGIVALLTVIGAVVGEDDEGEQVRGADTTSVVSDSTAAVGTTAAPATTAPATTSAAPTTTEAPPTTTTPPATSTVPPTTTIAPATVPPTTTAPVVPLDYTGSGDQVIQITLPDASSSVALAAIVYSGESNFAVWSLDEDLEQLDLLVNTIDAYVGTVPIGFRGQQVTALEITASGEWHVQLQPIAMARGMTDTIGGTGDEVFIFSGDTGIAHVTHDGDSNFALWGHPDASLLINEIGTYDGTIVLEGEEFYEVTADGNWTVTITS